MGAMHAIGEDVEIISPDGSTARGRARAGHLSATQPAGSGRYVQSPHAATATGALHHATIDEDLLAQVTRRPVDGLAADRNGVEPNVPPP
jgi:hypothetical protein